MSEMTSATLPLIGGALCLDFVNTVEGYRDKHPREFLTDYAELVMWGRHVEILSPPLIQKLIAAAARRPEDAAKVYQRALALRSGLYRLFAARLAKGKIRAEDLAAVNELLGEALSQGRLELTEDRYTWHWMSDADDLGQILYPIARSAADLLTSDRFVRLGECEDCGWLFIDMSKNHSRRWCSMNDCGNRSKARRYYQRTHKG